jgi:hypothetical protein
MFRRSGRAPQNPTPVEAMAHRLKTPEGRKLYALRKQTPEPVFDVIKSALGFRQFSLRGLAKARADRRRESRTLAPPKERPKRNTNTIRRPMKPRRRKFRPRRPAANFSPTGC